MTRRVLACLLAALGLGLSTFVKAQGPPPPAAQTAAAARPPAASLVKPATPTKAPGANGFLQRWLLLEPIRVSGQLSDSAVQSIVTAEYFPNQLSAVPADGETVKTTDAELTWHAVDTLGYNVNLYHFAYALNRPTSNVLF